MEQRKECNLCNTSVTSAGWAQHLKTQKHQRNDPNHIIQQRRVGRPRAANVHDKLKHCNLCNAKVTSVGWAQHLRTQKHQRNDPDNNITPRRVGRTNTGKIQCEFTFYKSVFEEPKVRTAIRAKDTAFRSRIQTLEIENSRNFLDAREFLNSIKFPVIGNIWNKLNLNNNMNVGVDVNKRVTRRRKKMRKRLAMTPPPPRFNSLNVNAVLFVEFKKGEEYQLENFKTSNEIITPTTNFDEFYEELVQNILNEIEEFEIRGSQWVLNQFLNSELRI